MATHEFKPLSPIERAEQRAKSPRPISLRQMGLVPTKDNMDLVKEALHTDAVAGGCLPLLQFGGMVFRELRLDKAGHYHQGHSHRLDHVTLLQRGKVLCEITGKESKVYEAPCVIEIKASDWHRFIALEDNTLYFCIFNDQGEKDPAKANKLTQEIAPEPAKMAELLKERGAKTAGQVKDDCSSRECTFCLPESV